MKKILIAFLTLFIINLGCKKIDDGGGLCACSLMPATSLSFIIKNSAGEDLLNAATPGAYTNNQIQLLSKDANGSIKQVSFFIRPSFSYGNEKFNFNQIFSEEIAALAKTTKNSLYLKLGNDEPRLLRMTVGDYKVEKLLIDNIELPLAINTPTNYSYLNSIFALTIN